MRFSLLLFLSVLAACAPRPATVVGSAHDPQTETAVSEALAAPPPPAAARSVEEFDTTSAAQRSAAADPASGGTLLGETVASLGDPSRPGFWMETPLVEAEQPGRLEYPANGKSVEVALLPVEGGSSRVSLAALRLLEAPLAGLPVLKVFRLE